MSAGQDFVALDWIKADISETLEKAQHSLESVAEKGDDASSMRACLTALHQVHGTLKMVEIEGPVLVAGEMEALAQALMNNDVPDVGHAQELLMQTILQMPGYLDRIQREQQDNPQFVRPTVNNLRVSRGAEKLGGDDEAPTASVFVGSPDEAVIKRYAESDGPATIKKLRVRYQQALSALLKKQSPRENLGLLAKVLQMQAKLCRHAPTGYFAEVMLAVVEGVATGALKLDGVLAGQLRKYDALLKVLAEGTPDSLGLVIPAEFVTQLHSVLEKASKETPRIEAAKALFAVVSAEVSLTEDVDFGPDDETIAAVSRILIEELNGVTDKLDLYVRSSARQISDLVQLVPMLEQISSTLLVVGKAEHQDSILNQIETIEAIESSTEQPTDDQLLDIAGALLQISSDLNRLVGDVDEDGESDHFGDLDEAQAAVIRETRNGLARSKDAVIEYISNNFAKDKLETLGDNLRSLGSGLFIVNQQRCADVLAACSRYVDEKLLGREVQPTLAELDDLADAVTSVDYFLERLLESTTDPYWQMVEVAEAAIAKLGYSVTEDLSATVISEEVTPITETNESADTEAVIAPSDVASEDVADELVEALVEKDLAPAPTDISRSDLGLDSAANELAQAIELEESKAEGETTVEDDDLIDDEIIEIFIEEAEEVLETIREYLPQWQSDLSNQEAATEVRRAFHTLKGSGRMVGATVVGELAWAIEDMLNRVLDNTIQVSPPLMDFLNEVVGKLPEGVEAFRLKDQSAFDTAEYTTRVAAITAGEELVEPSAYEEPSAEQEPSADEKPSAEQEPSADEKPSAEEEPSADMALSLDEDEEFAEELTFESDDLTAELESLSESVSELETPDEFTLEDLKETQAEDAIFELDDLTIESEGSVQSAESELDQIFLEEAQENLATLQLVLERAAPAVAPEAVAAYHTLKGSAGMAEVPAIATIAGPMEHLLAGMLGSSQSMTEDARQLMSESLVLMQAVTSELSLYRLSYELGDVFSDKVNSFTPADALLPVFDFQIVRHLSQAEPVLADWQLHRLAELNSELGQVVEQAQLLGHDSIVLLCQSLADTYTALDGKPDDASMTILLSAHEALVHMFDQLASSQQIEPATEQIAALSTIDFAALELRQHNIRSANEIAMAMEALDTHIADLGTSQDDGAIPLIKDDISRLLEHPSLQTEVLVTLELMLQLAEVTVDPQDEFVAHLLGCRAGLSNQLAELALGNRVALDSDLAGACRNALAARQSAVQATGTVADVAADVLIDVVKDKVAAEEEVPAAEDLLPADNIDEDVLPIFLEEAEELSEAIDESILVWSGDTNNSAHLDMLLRHLHTLKGGARLAGINSLGEFTHNFETFLISVQQSPVQLGDGFFALLNSRQDEITRRIEVYLKLMRGEATAAELESMRHDMPTGGAVPAVSGDVIDDVVNEAAAEPIDSANDASVVLETQALPEDEIDEDVLPIFVEEAEELLEAIDQCILEWSNRPEATEFHDDLLRHLHTLKGGARLAGINSLGEFAHNFETYLIGIQQNPVPLNEDFFAVLNVQQDEMTRRVEVYTKMAQGDVSEAEIASLAEAPAVVVTADASIAGDVVDVVPAPVVDEVNQESQEDKPSAASNSQEMVRVSAELLEELIGLAGESNITRSRVEQHIRDFGESLQEMEETINRVRDQVRRLEIEAESRETVFRRAREEQEGDSNFDDLEMDRYTMLQEISRTLNESSSDMLDLKETLSNKSRDAETLLHQQARIGTELQEGLTRTRMVPFARLIPRLRRIVRQVSTEVGKSVRFDAFNVEGELDRSVLERIVAPLEHMLRNAVDHGIESTEKRRASNKPETGRISLRLSREGGYVVLTISDDGGGINVSAVRKKAVERGVMTADSTLSDHEVMQFIIHAGFSTAEKLTQISGRGVGMDVVNSEIKQLGGSITIDSTLGVGSEFTIHIPFTVSINRALLVVVREEIYAVPLNTIEGIVRVSPYELEAYYQPDAPMFEYAGQPYRLAYMGKLLERGDNPILEGLVAPLPVILARSGENSVALQVDRVIGSREIVSKSLGPQFSNVAGVSGATVMGDGSVVVILDVLAFIRKSEEVITPEALEQAAEAEQLHRVRKVMIVDDSVTVRKVTTRLMERQGWEVTTAKDGLDAMNQLQDIYPDVVLLDIEMPKMDGFEVLKSVRRDPRLEKLPIIMITSRTGEKHKQQALELGVNQYLGKPFQEASLISTIDEVLAEANSKHE
jgi:chemosensory pili system protein ChpA (sensor histidine kinase/response regulator)